MWKQYKNTIYEANENGQVRNKNTGRIKSTRIKDNGYVILDLMIDGVRKTCHLHRIIAETFIPNPSNLPEINHKDQVKTNNCVDNLEWCDRTYNNTYGDIQRVRLNTLKMKGATTAPIQVQQLSLKGEVLATFYSFREAERQTGVRNSSISACCSGRCKTAGGYKWRKV